MGFSLVSFLSWGWENCKQLAIVLIDGTQKIDLSLCKDANFNSPTEEPSSQERKIDLGFVEKNLTSN